MYHQLYNVYLLARLLPGSQDTLGHVWMNRQVKFYR